LLNSSRFDYFQSKILCLIIGPAHSESNYDKTPSFFLFFRFASAIRLFSSTNLKSSRRSQQSESIRQACGLKQR